MNDEEKRRNAEAGATDKGWTRIPANPEAYGDATIADVVKGVAAKHDLMKRLTREFQNEHGYIRTGYDAAFGGDW